MIERRSRSIQVGDFVFHIDTGELRRDTASQADAHEESAPTRLPPQPARLLALLLEHPGEVVSHETIRETLWPDVTVDFEKGLHFCVRQVRSALGDIANTPTYIETIPRRGYRLIAKVKEMQLPPDNKHTDLTNEECATYSHTKSPTTVATDSRRPKRRGWLAVAAVALALVAGSTWMAGGADEKPIRIAVLPFDPPPAWWPAAGAAPKTAPVAELVLAGLTEIKEPPLEIIGPTTTQAYATDAETRQQLITRFNIDYYINPRFTTTEDGPLLLGELIRATDGAHVSVQSFRDFQSPDTIARQIVDKTRAFLLEKLPAQ